MAEYLVIRLDSDRDNAANWIVVDSNGTRISSPVSGPLAEVAKDVGDRAVIVLVPATMVLGGVIVGLALMLEKSLAPPLWVHAVLWTPLVIILTLAILPRLKGLSVGLQYRFRSTEEETPPGGA